MKNGALNEGELMTELDGRLQRHYTGFLLCYTGSNARCAFFERHEAGEVRLYRLAPSSPTSVATEDFLLSVGTVGGDAGMPLLRQIGEYLSPDARLIYRLWSEKFIRPDVPSSMHSPSAKCAEKGNFDENEYYTLQIIDKSKGFLLIRTFSACFAVAEVTAALLAEKALTLESAFDAFLELRASLLRRGWYFGNFV